MPRANQSDDFRAPGDNLLARLIIHHVVLPYLRCIWMRTRVVDIAEADRQRLLEACRGAAMICPNHPSLHEPVIVFDLLRRLGIRANYMMARDTMSVLKAWQWVLQGVGVFSIRRGLADRAAFAATRKLLKDDRPVVAFPEGETSGLGDRLLAFQEGVVQLAYWGLQDKVKDAAPAPVRLVPLAVKYYYRDDATAAIDRALTNLEKALGLTAAETDRYQRLRNVGLACVSALEREFELPVREEASLDDRLETMYQRMLDRIAAAVGVNIARDGTRQDVLRRLFAAVESELTEPEAASDYERRMQSERLPAWRAFERDLARLQTFQAVRDGYVAEHPSAERYLDVIGRLEVEVLGRAKVHQPRRAVVRVGEPIDLAERWPAYQADRRAAVEQTNAELRERVAALVEELGRAAPVIG